MGKTYKLSTDYDLLKELLDEGHELAGFVNYGGNKNLRDVCKIKYIGDCPEAGVRGHCYFNGWRRGEEWEQFIEYAKEANLAFIPPTKDTGLNKQIYKLLAERFVKVPLLVPHIENKLKHIPTQVDLIEVMEMLLAELLNEIKTRKDIWQLLKETETCKS